MACANTSTRMAVSLTFDGTYQLARPRHARGFFSIAPNSATLARETMGGIENASFVPHGIRAGRVELFRPRSSRQDSARNRQILREGKKHRCARRKRRI